jgi:methylenetetrahydrofolate dehydrogenase (NADP+)/methenyltetrahydrofolate cyclohydrolase
MSGQLIDGKVVSRSIKEALKPRVEALKAKGIIPGLAAVLVGDDPASESYVSSKAKTCSELGMYSEVIRRPSNFTQAELVALVQELNRNPNIHGILVQSPVPSHIDEMTVTLTIDPLKDVDGFHPYNVGMMLLGHGGLLPCTPYGIIKLLEFYDISPSGKEVVVVGRSNIVGKPVAALLVQKGKMADATVTIAHSRTPNLGEVTRRADILIVAIGRPGTVTGEMVKPGAVVIDVGVNRVESPASMKGYKLVGDVEFESCAARASYITPVPGGVGPMTIAMLMSNTVAAAERFSSR